MKMLMMVGILGMLAGCGASAWSSGSISIRSPDGKENWIGITCNSHILCMQTAGYECPNGYVVQDKDGHWSTQSDERVFGDVASAHSGEVYKGEMIIKCSGKSRIEIENENLHYDSHYDQHYESYGSHHDNP